MKDIIIDNKTALKEKEIVIDNKTSLKDKKYSDDVDESGETNILSNESILYNKKSFKDIEKLEIEKSK